MACDPSLPGDRLTTLDPADMTAAGVRTERAARRAALLSGAGRGGPGRPGARRNLMRLADLVARARALASGRRAILGIVGSPGAGKTTLAMALLDALRAELGPEAVAHVPMDGFHLADVALRRLGLLDRKGAPETFDVGGYVALLRRLRAEPGDTVHAPVFERDLEQPLAGAIAVPPGARLVLTEGNYLLLDTGRWGEVRAELDEAWFCDLSPDVRLARLITRHVTFGKEPDRAAAWVAAVDGPNAALVEATRDRADLIVPSEVVELLAPDRSASLRGRTTGSAG